MKKRAFTLVEVIVAIAILAIALVGIGTTFRFTTKMETINDYYIHFESICIDIDTYLSKYKNITDDEWDKHYFGTHYEEGATIYYSSDYHVVSDASQAKFVLVYGLNEDDELIVNVKEKDSNRVIIRDLNYGGVRYAQTTNP